MLNVFLFVCVCVLCPFCQLFFYMHLLVCQSMIMVLLFVSMKRAIYVDRALWTLSKKTIMSLSVFFDRIIEVNAFWCIFIAYVPFGAKDITIIEVKVCSSVMINVISCCIVNHVVLMVLPSWPINLDQVDRVHLKIVFPVSVWIGI